MNSGTLASGSVGQYCSIGPEALIGLDSHDPTLWSTSPYVMNQGPQPAPPIIEDDVWIGARVTVLRGTRIGRGAVVAAGAVVTRDVAPFTIVGGVPARWIKDRFSDETQRSDVEEKLKNY
jgi:acetyltransferase-like isoleucine patch superfamily enzyme